LRGKVKGRKKRKGQREGEVKGKGRKGEGLVVSGGERKA
jgi:hypothetical protein